MALGTLKYGKPPRGRLLAISTHNPYPLAGLAYWTTFYRTEIARHQEDIWGAIKSFRPALVFLESPSPFVSEIEAVCWVLHVECRRTPRVSGRPFRTHAGLFLQNERAVFSPGEVDALSYLFAYHGREADRAVPKVWVPSHAPVHE